MFATATIVFREILEIALVLGIVMAATRELPGRGRIVLTGLGIGMLCSVLVACFTEAISNAVDGVGQEVFNACVMFTAVGFLGWTVVWMKRHARDISHHLRRVSHDVVEGNRAPYVLVSIIALATLREGTEVVLFTYSLLAAGQATISAILLGSGIGLAGGVVIGFMLYYGLLRAARKHVFSVTSWMLILLTAGMAAQGANYLVAADILPALSQQVWDTSGWISGSSLMGKILSVLIGYSARPNGMELVFYASVMALISICYHFAGRATTKPQTAHA